MSGDHESKPFDVDLAAKVNLDKTAFPGSMSGGLSKREYAALHILTGICNRVDNRKMSEKVDLAVRYADELFVRLEQP